MIRTATALLLLGIAATAAAAPPACKRAVEAAGALGRLETALAAQRFVTYEPTSLTVIAGRLTRATESSIREDLTVLRQSFDALITYEAGHGAELIPAIAAELGYKTLIIGLWDPADEAEAHAALSAANAFPDLVAGLAVGNETLFARRQTGATLTARIKALRTRHPRLLFATSEPFHMFHEPAARPALAELDFLLPNVHPIFQPWFQTASQSTAAQFVVNVVAGLKKEFCGPILVKETGLPSAPRSAGFTPERQAAFYRALRDRLPPSRRAAFSYFSAFDAPWRAADALTVPNAARTQPHEEEAHWGLYDAQRVPKLAATEVEALE